MVIRPALIDHRKSVSRLSMAPSPFEPSLMSYMYLQECAFVMRFGTPHSNDLYNKTCARFQSQLQAPEHFASVSSTSVICALLRGSDLLRSRLLAQICMSFAYTAVMGGHPDGVEMSVARASLLSLVITAAYDASRDEVLNTAAPCVTGRFDAAHVVQ